MNNTAKTYAVSILREALASRSQLTANQLKLSPETVIASNTWERELHLGSFRNRKSMFLFNFCPFTWLEIYDDLRETHEESDILFTEAGPVGLKAKNKSELTGAMNALAQRNIDPVFLRDSSADTLLGLSILCDELAGHPNRPKNLIHYLDTILKSAKDRFFRNSKHAEASLKAAADILEEKFPGVTFVGRKGCQWPRIEYSDSGSFDSLKIALVNPLFSEFRNSRSFIFKYDAENLCLSCYRSKEHIGDVSFPFEPNPALCLLIKQAILEEYGQNSISSTTAEDHSFNLQALRAVA